MISVISLFDIALMLRATTPASKSTSAVALAVKLSSSEVETSQGCSRYVSQHLTFSVDIARYYNILQYNTWRHTILLFVI